MSVFEVHATEVLSNYHWGHKTTQGPTHNTFESLVEHIDLNPEMCKNVAQKSRVVICMFI